ncbi:hypothetical protein BpHYR1_038029 [Brachionus plicatilis]|uniref:Uncharacterized protein n=1 Tax=Brachionus plicatilis TaxID=10195 RepID=A0A3M7R7T5_BRAPC|nr:hypothetical protein BpHYR1_038029 [Brachionus plicatilis]
MRKKTKINHLFICILLLFNFCSTVLLYSITVLDSLIVKLPKASVSPDQTCCKKKIYNNSVN